jgi:hypothetical protein
MVRVGFDPFGALTCIAIYRRARHGWCSSVHREDTARRGSEYGFSMCRKITGSNAVYPRQCLWLMDLGYYRERRCW